MKVAQAQPRVRRARYLYLMLSIRTPPWFCWFSLPPQPRSPPNSLSSNRCFSLDGGISPEIPLEDWAAGQTEPMFDRYIELRKEGGGGRLSSLNDIDPDQI